MPALKKGLSGLEPYEGKLSRTVLRGGSGGNITLLPDPQRAIITKKLILTNRSKKHAKNNKL